MSIPEYPHTRIERYLDVMAGGNGTKPTEPHTRIERYLDDISDHMSKIITPEMFGAVGDGNADDTEALQKALADGLSSGLQVIANQTYKITSTITAQSDFIVNGLIVYDGDDVGLVIQKDRDIIRGIDVKVRIKASSQRGDVQATGVKVLNTVNSNINIDYVRNFYYGCYIEGNDAGTAYNKFTLGTIGNCTRNLTLISTGTSGWVNENLFIGGRLYCDTDSPYRPYNAITITSTRNYNNNANTFIKQSLEHANIGINIEYGSRNHFYDVRTEGATNAAKFTGTSSYNVVDVNYGVITNEDSTGYNTVRYTNTKDMFDIYDSGNLDNICVTDSTKGAVCGKLYMFDVTNNTVKNSMSRAASNIHGISGLNAIPGVIIDNITANDRYSFRITGTNLVYRICLVQFDSNGNLITASTTVIPPTFNLKSEISTHNMNYISITVPGINGSAWFNGADIINNSEYSFKPSPNATKIFIGIAFSGAEMILNRLHIMGTGGQALNAFPVVQTSAKPTSNGWYTGMTVYSSAPTLSVRGWWWDGTAWQTFS